MENTVFNHELNIFVQVDAIKSMSDDGDHWIFEGIASTADVDLYNEVVYPESFLNSIDFFKDNGKIFFDHDYAKQNADWLSDHGFSKDEILSLRTPIGKPLDAKLTNEGLYIRAVLNKEHPMARLMWNQYLNNADNNFRDQLGLSIGAKYLGQPRKEFDVSKGKHVTYLPDLLLYEVSLTPEPVNPHTKSWAATLKSMMREADTENSGNESTYHKIEPDSIVFDDDSNTITVKSVVEDADGVVHTFESVINLKEDIKKSMEKDDMAIENVVEAVETVELEPVEVDTQKATPEEMQQMAAQQEEGQEGAPEGAPEGEVAPEGMAPEGEEGMDAEGASSVLEELAAESEQEAAEGEGETEADDSMGMMLDKMDTVLDALSNLTEMLQNSAPESEPAEEQVTTQPPSLDMAGMKSVVQEAVAEVLKSVEAEETEVEAEVAPIELSEESAAMLAETIKSALVSAEENIVNRVIERVLDESIVTKSVAETETVEEEVVHPGTQTDGVTENDVDAQVMKSVPAQGGSEFTVEQMDTLKSMVGEYIEIRGYTADKSQQRARIIERAQDDLGLHPSLFNVYVNKAQKGKF